MFFHFYSIFTYIIQYEPKLAPGTNLRGARKTHRTFSTIDKHEPKSSPRSDFFLLKFVPKSFPSAPWSALRNVNGFVCNTFQTHARTHIRTHTHTSKHGHTLKRFQEYTLNASRPTFSTAWHCAQTSFRLFLGLHHWWKGWHQRSEEVGTCYAGLKSCKNLVHVERAR